MKRTIPILLFLFVCLSACTPKVYPDVRTEYLYRDRIVADTLVKRDSVYIREKTKGDTVYVTAYRDRILNRVSVRTDTVSKEIHDTTTLRVETIKPLSPVQSFKIGAFPWLLTAILVLLAWTFRKQLLKLLVK